jgi:hypothetical protein
MEKAYEAVGNSTRETLEAAGCKMRCEAIGFGSPDDGRKHEHVIEEEDGAASQPRGERNEEEVTDAHA